MNRRLIFFLVFPLFACVSQVYAQDPRFSAAMESICQSDLMKHLEYLSSDAMEGRKTGETGIHLAGEYLVQQFKNLGLESPDRCNRPYVQEYRLQTTNDQKVQLSFYSDTLLQGTDFIARGTSAPVLGEFPVLFAGYGIDAENYSSYKGIDPTGHVVVYLTGEPVDRNGKYLVSGNYLPTYGNTGFIKDSIALSRGAIATIRIDPDSARSTRLIRMLSRFSQGMQMQMIEDEASRKKGYGTILIHAETAAKLIGLSYDQLITIEARLHRGQHPRVKPVSPVSLHIGEGERTVVAENIAGFIRGKDHPDELVVVTAHFDHLGMKGDDIYNGADDNASGTVAILEVAEAFAQAVSAGHRPSRSILFLPVSGEEMGLLGSRYYARDPLFPIRQTRYNINMDMIGRTDKKHENSAPYVYVYISDSSGSLMHQKAQAAYGVMETDLAPEFVFKSSYGVRTGGSDHMSFEGVGVPVFYFFNGTHPDYHRPSDTYEKINGHNLEQTTRLVFSVLWNLAND